MPAVPDAGMALPGEWVFGSGSRSGTKDGLPPSIRAGSIARRLPGMAEVEVMFVSHGADR